MKIKKFLIVILSVVFSIFMVACSRDSKNITNNKSEFSVVGNNTVKEVDDEDLKSDRKEYTQQNPTEDKYYIKLKEAWQTQKDYIESINDPTVKKSVQTPESAAIMESNTLLIKYPGDAEAIDESLKRVLNGE